MARVLLLLMATTDWRDNSRRVLKKRDHTARRMGRRLLRKEKVVKPLPRFFLLIGYVVCLAWILFCGLYTIAVAISFGPNVSTVWLTSCLSSTAFEALVQDPTKILIVILIAEKTDMLVECYYTVSDFMPFEIKALSNWVDSASGH